MRDPANEFAGSRIHALPSVPCEFIRRLETAHSQAVLTRQSVGHYMYAPSFDPARPSHGGSVTMAALPAQQSRTAPAQQAYGEVVRRYLELREAHPGVLLLFRVG